MKNNLLSLTLVGVIFSTVPGCSIFESAKETDEAKNEGGQSVDPSLKQAKDAERGAQEAIRTRPEDAAISALRKRVLVLPFQNKAGIGGPELGKHAASQIRNRLSKIPELLVVEEKDIQGMENMVPEHGNLNYRYAFDRAKAYGIVALVTGTIDDVQVQEKGNQVGLFRTRYNSVEARLRVQMYDVGMERPLYNETSSAEVIEEHTKIFGNRRPDSYDVGKGEGAVDEALEKAFPGLLTETQRIGWMGRIAKIDLHRYYINAGELSGISKGQMLRVFGDAQPIVDQESGLVIGMAPGRFKGILKVVDFFGTDGAVAIIHAGAGFHEKDRVEVFAPPQP